MGCVFGKLFGTGHDQLSDTNEEPKVYSWDKREKIDVKNFVLDQLKDEVVGRLPGSINGQQFIIQNCENCDIYVFDHCATVTVDDCTNCRIFIAAIKSSIFIRDCNNCVVATCCQQFRTRDCRKIDVFLCCVTQPIIEATTGIKFGCFPFHYPQFESHLQAAGLSPFDNNWSNIHDFTTVPGENNYGFMQKSIIVTDYLPIPTKEPLDTVRLTVGGAENVIPFSVGVKQRPAGHGCLIIVFSCEAQHSLANEIISKLKDLVLVQTAKMSLSEQQAKTVFGAETYSRKTSLGPVVMLEFSVHDIDLCKSMVQTVGNAENVHVSDCVETAAREIECFNSLTEMQMAV